MSRSWLLYCYFSIDAEIIWEVATTHVPRMLAPARRLRDEADSDNPGTEE